MGLDFGWRIFHGRGFGGEGNQAMPMASNDSQPVHCVHVDGFWIDATAVTNAQFEKFVRATGYVTIAERTRQKRHEENLVAGSVVFAPTDHQIAQQSLSMVDISQRRELASPVGRKGYQRKEQLSCCAYCTLTRKLSKWAGKRSPTEAEFEFAARGGLSGKTYVWGDEFRPGEKWMANTWQGNFQMMQAKRLRRQIAGVKSFSAKRLWVFFMAGECSGNGAATGIALITAMKLSPTKAESHAIHKDRTRHLRASLTKRNEFVAARSFVMTILFALHLSRKAVTQHRYKSWAFAA